MDRYPLQGRESEMFRLGAAWGGAVRGRPALILLSGPAGVGRTRLAAETADLAARTGGTVRWVDRARPAAAAGTPTLLVLDDADPADLVPPGAGTRMLVVATVADGDRMPADATRIDVRPLAPAALSRLAEVAGQPDAADRIRERTGGLPLFAVEALRDLAAGAPDVPESFDALVGDRVRRLGEPAGRILRAAAVDGKLDPATLAPFGAAAVAARLLVPTRVGYAFAHELIRAALRGD
jgi:hypothetical protein